MNTMKISSLAVGLIMTSLLPTTAYARGHGSDRYIPSLTGKTETYSTYSSGDMITMMSSLDSAQREQMLRDCMHIMTAHTPAPMSLATNRHS